MANATGSTWPEKWTINRGKSWQVSLNGAVLSPRGCWTVEGVAVDPPTGKVVMSELNKEVVDLVWGRPSSGGVSASIFRRWTQGNGALSRCNDVNEQRRHNRCYRDFYLCAVERQVYSDFNCIFFLLILLLN